MFSAVVGVFTLSGQVAPVGIDRDHPAQDELSIDEAIREGVARSYAVGSAREAFSKATAARQEAKGRLGPTVQYDYSYLREDENLLNTLLGFRITTPVDWRNNVHVRQNIFAGGEVRNGLRAAVAEQSAADYDLIASISDEALRMRLDYYDVALAQAQLAVHVGSLELARSTLHDAENRFQCGALPKVDVLRAKVDLGNAISAMLDAKKKLHDARITLLQAIGLLGSGGTADLERVRFISALDYQPNSFYLPTALSTANLLRADLTAARLRKEAGEFNIKRAQAREWPKLSFDGGYQLNGTVNVFDDLTRTRNGWYYQFQGSLTLFDSLQTRAQVRQALAGRRQEVNAVAELTAKIEAQVRSSFGEFNVASDALKTNDSVVLEAQEALSISEQEFQQGLETELAVLQTKETLTQARLNRIQALYDYNVAVANLRHACGLLDYAIGDYSPYLPRAEKSVRTRTRQNSRAPMYRP